MLCALVRFVKVYFLVGFIFLFNCCIKEKRLGSDSVRLGLERFTSVNFMLQEMVS